MPTSLPSSIIYGAYPIKTSETVTLSGPGQYDSLEAEWIYDTAAGLSLAEGAAYPGYSKLFVERLSLRVTGETGTASISCLGLVSMRAKTLRRVSAFGQEVSIGPTTYEGSELVGIDTDGDGEPDDTARQLVEVLRTTVTPSGSGKRWIISEPMLGVVDTYFMDTLPDTTLIGTQLAPPNAPPNPAYIWGGFQDALRFVHPNGWVLENREYDSVFPNIYQVIDTYAFKHPARPD